MAFFDKPRDQSDLLGEVFHCGWLDMRRQDVESGAVLMKTSGPFSSELVEASVFFLGLPDRFVIDVGNVSDVQGCHSTSLNDTAKDILHHKGAEVPNMRRAVDGGATAIEP
jgi:hypothetical protein